MSEEELKSRLEAQRKSLQTLVLEYKEFLRGTQVAANRTVEENRKRTDVLYKINDETGKLEFLNEGEGLMTLCITALNSVLLLKDEINDLRFQNAVLNKKIKKLTDEK